MKPVTGVILAGAFAGVAAASRPGEVPEIVLDESAARWVVDRFAGNSTAGPRFFQGPARETGGLGRPFVAPVPDGTVYLATGGRILEVAPEGTLRLVAGGGSNLGECAARYAAVKVESMAYSLQDRSVYFVHRTIPCVRRLYQKGGEWRVGVVAGSPSEAGEADGRAGAARFRAPMSLAVTSKGAVYVLDGTSHLRRIEGGRVSTLARFKRGNNIVDGPLAGATLSVTNMSGMICPGEDDETLYVADHWHFAARRIDLKKMTISTVAGMPKPKEWRKERQTPLQKRYNKSSDGPALTHASFNSGCAFVCWDPVHSALWLDGPDAVRLRWLRDGWVRTVLSCKGSGKWPQDALGVPGDKVRFTWTHIRAVDAEGRAYIMAGSSKTGVWRAYERGGAR